MPHKKAANYMAAMPIVITEVLPHVQDFRSVLSEQFPAMLRAC